MYNCIMKMEATQEKSNRIILEDKSEYFYSVKPFQILNALGAVKAILEEYVITNDGGEIYKLYKTKEGSWYDISNTSPVENGATLRALKLAIDGR